MGKHIVYCRICGLEIYVYKSEIGKRQFCSKVCADIAQKRRIQRICEACGRAFEVIPSSIKYGRGRTCSRKCQYSLIGEKIQKRHPKQWHNKTCKNCGLEFRCFDKRQKFCTRNCWLDWNSGENHFNYKDGTGNYPHPLEFNDTLKTQIRQRDQYQCQRCGTKKNYRQFSVHHIDYCKTNNNFKNLITLCDACHIKTNYNREYWQSYFEYLIKDTHHSQQLAC